MRFADLQAFVTDGLTVADGYDATNLDGSFPVINPGPASLDTLQKLSPGRIIFLTLGGGPGLTTEGLYDRLFISTRVIGLQNDHDDAENLAWQLDTIFLEIGSNAVIGDAQTLYITRSGGGPVLLEKDAADRYHFTCSYITETRTGR